jgi:hypothetical protein
MTLCQKDLYIYIYIYSYKDVYKYTYLLLGWSETESTITEATTGLLYRPQMMIDDECGAVGGCLAGETEVLGENLPQCRFVN